jgi:hypothetical protein
MIIRVHSSRSMLQPPTPSRSLRGAAHARYLADRLRRDPRAVPDLNEGIRLAMMMGLGQRPLELEERQALQALRRLLIVDPARIPPANDPVVVLAQGFDRALEPTVNGLDWGRLGEAADERRAQGLQQAGELLARVQAEPSRRVTLEEARALAERFGQGDHLLDAEELGAVEMLAEEAEALEPEVLQGLQTAIASRGADWGIMNAAHPPPVRPPMNYDEEADYGALSA